MPHVTMRCVARVLRRRGPYKNHILSGRLKKHDFGIEKSDIFGREHTLEFYGWRLVSELFEGRLKRPHDFVW